MTYRPRQLTDVAVGNDKTLTTDTEDIGLAIEVLALKVTATATVGTRAIDVVVTDGTNEVMRLVAVLANTADDVLLAYLYPGSGDGELPPFTFRPGWTIQVVDTADTDVLDKIEVFAYFAGTERIG